MANNALLNNVEHQDIRIITRHSTEFGDDRMYTLTFPFEFRNIQACYPILFHKDAKDELYPVALFGFMENENLFLDESGWHAPYIPAMIRREPFLIGYQGSEIADDVDKPRVLSIDLDNPRVNKEEGELLFQPLGGRTPFLEEMANLLETIYTGYMHNRIFMDALKEHDLVEAVTLDITLNDGSENQLLGFHTINEDKVEQLPGDVLQRFGQQQILMPLFMVLASMANFRSLIDLKNKQLED